MRRSVVLVLIVALSACGKKKAPEVVAPVEGWAKGGETWPGQCYHPVNYEELSMGNRRMARQDALEAMKAQWLGQRGDGVQFDKGTVMDLETVLLGYPDQIEMVSVVNLQKCKEAMESGGHTAKWEQWLAGLPAKLTEGDCTTPPLTYTLFDYLDVAKTWQVPAYVCEGDYIRVKASSLDFYRVEDGGPWINADGDPSRLITDAEFPCNVEGCYLGQLVMRFTGESGVVMVVPVGLERTWTAPEHGKIEVMINDTTFYDNVYKKEGALIHHASIEYSPAD